MPGFPLLSRVVERHFAGRASLPQDSIERYLSGYCDFEPEVGEWLADRQGHVRLMGDQTGVVFFLLPGVTPKLLASSLIDALESNEDLYFDSFLNEIAFDSLNPEPGERIPSDYKTGFEYLSELDGLECRVVLTALCRLARGKTFEATSDSRRQAWRRVIDRFAEIGVAKGCASRPIESLHRRLLLRLGV